VNLDDLEPGRNFPALDFVSGDGRHGVSIKTVDPLTQSFREGNVFYGSGTDRGPIGLIGHAQELVDRALVTRADSRVTLDIRVPAGTSADTMSFISETILDNVQGDVGRLDVIVRRFP
jgi:hypothetical protein